MKTSLLLAGAAVLFTAFANISPAEAKGHYLGPEVFDYSDSNAFYPKQAPVESSQPSCYIEPSGPHTQIRWESACATAARQFDTHARPDSTSTYVAPRGFHNQISWD